jgi:hypothetical protein
VRGCVDRTVALALFAFTCTTPLHTTHHTHTHRHYTTHDDRSNDRGLLVWWKDGRGLFDRIAVGTTTGDGGERAGIGFNVACLWRSAGTAAARLVLLRRMLNVPSPYERLYSDRQLKDMKRRDVTDGAACASRPGRWKHRRIARRGAHARAAYTKTLTASLRCFKASTSAIRYYTAHGCLSCRSAASDTFLRLALKL